MQRSPSGIGSRTAWDILYQDGSESDHAKETESNHFNFESLLLVMLDLKLFDDEGIESDHVNKLDELVRSLDGMTENFSFDPGQFYVSPNLHLLKELQIPLLALLAAKISQEAQENDAQVTQRFAELVGKKDSLKGGGKSVQRIGEKLRSIRSSLDPHTESLFHGISELIPDANAQEAVKRLHKVLSGAEQLINRRGESIEEGNSAN